MSASPSHHEPPIAAVILAAGLSRRMGALKPLLPLVGRPMIVRVVETFVACEVRPILLVTGHEAQQVQQAVAGTGVVCVHNPRYAQDMLTSVQAGVAALPKDIGAFFVALGDQPGVRSKTIGQMMRTWRERRPMLVRPVLQGRHGHPVLFSAELAGEILALRPGQTLKTVVQQHHSRALECHVDDAGVVEDVDTPEDYERAKGRINAE